MKRNLLSVCTVCALSFAGYSQTITLKILFDGDYKKDYISSTDRTVLTLKGTGCKFFRAESEEVLITQVNQTESYVFPNKDHDIAYIHFYCVRDTATYYLGTMRKEIR